MKVTDKAIEQFKNAIEQYNTPGSSIRLFASNGCCGLSVGLSSGITDSSMSPVLEFVYIFQMWAGRLEILPVFALIRAIFWGTSPKML